MTATFTLGTPQSAAEWLRARVRGTLHTDSRQVRPGDGFVAWPGAATDGRRYVKDALAQGALACLVERDGIEAFDFSDAAIASYAQLKADTGPIADAYYDSPSNALSVVAVTGTNGKTSSAWWLASALSKLKLPALSPCGVVGTLGIGVPPAMVDTGMTTPDPVLLQRRLREFVDMGVCVCAMEASSIGIAEHRLDGTRVRIAMFTNFTQDHLDYHGSMQAYWLAKAALFERDELQAAVVNLDDPRGGELAALADQRGLDVWTYSLQGSARLQGSGLVHGQAGLTWQVQESGASLPLATALVGEFNAANVMGVLAALRALGVPLEDAVAACADLPPVPGRMEQVAAPGAPLAVIDYAHTPDALVQALRALRPLASARNGQLWCVFGCGGNRDASKRPHMAAAAEGGADRIVLTSDNPRDESPQAIIADAMAGLKHPDQAVVEPDRLRAIHAALAQAAPEDVVLIAGKGHEAYQEVRGERLPFSDVARARAALRGRTMGGEVAA